MGPCATALHLILSSGFSTTIGMAIILLSVSLALTCSEFQTQLSRDVFLSISNSRVSKMEPFTGYLPCPLTPSSSPSSHHLQLLPVFIPSHSVASPADSDCKFHAASPFPLPSPSVWSFITFHVYFCDCPLNSSLQALPLLLQSISLPPLPKGSAPSCHLHTQNPSVTLTAYRIGHKLLCLAFKVLCNRAPKLPFSAHLSPPLHVPEVSTQL